MATLLSNLQEAIPVLKEAEPPILSPRRTRRARGRSFYELCAPLEQQAGPPKPQSREQIQNCVKEFQESFKKSNTMPDEVKGNQIDTEPKLNVDQKKRNSFDKCASKNKQSNNGIVRAYAANTDQGLIRKYNEDRVSIILNIIRPSYRSNIFWPRSTFFGVYDGHGGASCANFLRDNLHRYVICDDNFPQNPREALLNGFLRAEKEFLHIAQSTSPHDKSGSCALVVLIIGDICYIANTGDSRAILSVDKGARVLELSKDHKPNSSSEKQRIIDAGGSIYQSQHFIKTPNKDKTVIQGPLRTLPGRLSVSRAIGDIEAKSEKLGGKAGVVIADPEIKIFRVLKTHDFIFMGCDGIFDRMSNQEVTEAAWQSIRKEKMNSEDLNVICLKAVDSVINKALQKKSTDNLTGLILSFTDLSEKAAPPSPIINFALKQYKAMSEQLHRKSNPQTSSSTERYTKSSKCLFQDIKQTISKLEYLPTERSLSNKYEPIAPNQSLIKPYSLTQNTQQNCTPDRLHSQDQKTSYLCDSIQDPNIFSLLTKQNQRRFSLQQSVFVELTKSNFLKASKKNENQNNFSQSPVENAMTSSQQIQTARQLSFIEQKVRELNSHKMITTALTETSNLSSTTKTNPFHIPNRRHSRSTLRKLESA